MSSIPVLTGLVPFDAPNADQQCTTWYTIFGSLKSTRNPVIVLHGGPSVPHNYLLPIKDLWLTHQIPVIFYDQIGAGKSSHLPEKPTDFWCIDLFVAELENLIAHLRTEHGVVGYDVLGQSWGGMLATCFAAQKPRPKGLRKLIIANAPSSQKGWIEAGLKLLDDMPNGVRESLLTCEREGRTESAEYQSAMDIYIAKHVNRVTPMPAENFFAMESMASDMSAYLAMNGAEEFHPSGNLRDFTVVPLLQYIKVPTLLINGRYDEAQDSVTQPYFDGIEKVKWVRMMESSHSPQWEEPELFLEVVGGFLS